ncbi:MAG TPA: hypothetical protein PKW33_07125 [Anaerolineaceae bacterium]|nr:hypothetical protein [Anaerolineaceae bacterium]HPN51342.1 hypothetical protein [Anaerolineaceae bacterium]
MNTIGFAGTAKNTGKTTTARFVLAAAHRAGLRLALTSIGYDGENRDTITGLPKPRFELQPGDWLATAEKCLKTSTAVCRVEAVLPIQTILGRVVLAQVEQAGEVLAAGPNRAADIRLLLERLEALGVDLAMLDGALNRVAPMNAADGLVLATGAAYDERIPAIAAHAAALAGLFQLPQVEQTAGFTPCPGGSLLRGMALPALSRGLRLAIPGACDPALLLELLPQMAGGQLHFGSPLNLAASGSPLDWKAVMHAAGELQIGLSVARSLPVRLMTVNPFFPHYQPQTGAYVPDFVPAADLLQAVRQAAPQLPVYDMLQEPHPDVLSLLQLT